MQFILKLHKISSYIFQNAISCYSYTVQGKTDSGIGILRAWSPDKSFRNNGRWVLCEFKVSAGSRTRAKVADDSLGV